MKQHSEENAANILKAKLETKKRNIFLALSVAYLLIYFRNYGAIKKALTILYTIGQLKEVNMVLFLRNKRFNVMLFWADYYLRWWTSPIEERTCRKTDLGGGEYYLRNSGLPPLLDRLG